RGLENYLDKIMVMNPGNTLVASTPPPDLAERQKHFQQGRGTLREKMLAYEKQLLEQALELAGGNQSEAARMLGLREQTFRYRLGKNQLPKSRKTRATRRISAIRRDAKRG